MPTVITPAPALVTVTCYLCGVPFAMPDYLQAQRLKDRRDFWCPNGHEQRYLGETEAQRLAKELDATKATLANARRRSDELLEQRSRAERRITAYKGVVKRTKNRIAKGTCPCCSATFKNVEQHIKTRHPNWNPEAGAEAMAGKSA